MGRFAPNIAKNKPQKFTKNSFFFLGLKAQNAKLLHPELFLEFFVISGSKNRFDHKWVDFDERMA